LGSDINYLYVKNIVIHPDYKEDLVSVVNDIAILKLANPIPETLAIKVARISLPKSHSENLRADTEVKAIGWGATQEPALRQPFQTSNTLQSAVFTILNASECARRSNANSFPDTKICIDSSSSGVCKVHCRLQKNIQKSSDR
jgi:secreted trypsin-like serine protease